MIKVSSINSNLKFKVLGVYGEFAVQPSKWKICHFSTFASSNNESRAGNSESLLRELKPMRERVSPKQIKDMSALLQRDLNDSRVANELIPYLCNNSALIGFFPAILCALVPSGFLDADEKDSISYPDLSQVANDLINFDGLWQLKFFQNEDGKNSALGELEIDPKKTDIIVLDGQHRANAFRYVTNTFPDATNPDSIYSYFYKGIQHSDAFDAELPVTIVWFKKLKGEDVNPRVISRRLFVDVNTNAKSVSRSRNILLDDASPSCIFTNVFYTKLAKNNFSSGELSLLHGAFDSNDDNNKSSMSLFTPVAMEYAFRLFIFGRDECNGLSYSMQRDRSGSHQNTARLLRFFDLINDSQKKAIDFSKILQSLAMTEVREALSLSAMQFVSTLLSKFLPFQIQIQSTNELESAITAGDWSNTTRLTVWNKVYCGGEGLYSSLTENEVSTSLQAYKQGIKEIEEKFKILRATNCGDSAGLITHSAYSVLTSIAGITGLLMATSKCSETQGWLYKEDEVVTQCADFVVNALNKTTMASWLVIMTEFKSGVVKALEPKKWPDIRNIYLRVIENNSEGRFKFFAQEVALSPDARFVNSDFEKRVSEYKENNADEEPSQEKRRELRSKSIIKLNACLAKCGLKQIINDEYAWPEGPQNGGNVEDEEAQVNANLDSEDDGTYLNSQI